MSTAGGLKKCMSKAMREGLKLTWLEDLKNEPTTHHLSGLIPSKLKWLEGMGVIKEAGKEKKRCMWGPGVNYSTALSFMRELHGTGKKSNTNAAN